jgi:hypothetical protein
MIEAAETAQMLEDRLSVEGDLKLTPKPWLAEVNET